jgi:acetyl esterase/lipase
MSKTIAVVFLFSFIFGTIKSEERYLTQIFDSVEVHTYTYIVKDGVNLDLDVYTPFGDSDVDRAVLLYIHGGGFSEGTRDGSEIPGFCRQLAGYGYVAVSMSYRLTRKGQPTGFGCDCPAEEKLNTFQAAREDIQDATFFLIQNREMLGIDPQRVILAGSSAGAEAALIAAYMPPNCFDLPSGPVSYAGVISMAGAIPYLENLYEDSAVPTLFFHGTCDNLVPYGTAPHHYCQSNKPGFLTLHGSYTLSQKLGELGVPYWLHTTCGGGHELNISPLRDYFDEIIEFCHDYLIGGSGENRHTIIPGNAKACEYEQYDFCAN